MSEIQRVHKGHGKLMAYMMGFRRGAAAGATNQEQMANPDFVKGYNDGRNAVGSAYKKACKKYQAELSPLRQ